MPERTPPVSHADLLDRPIFAHLATIRPDGAPQSSVMWFEWDGEHLSFTHTKTRQKFRNLSREGRVAVSLVDPDNAYRFLEVRGEVDTIEDDPTGAFYNRLSERYSSGRSVRDPDVRVIIKVRPTAFVAVESGLVVRP